MCTCVLCGGVVEKGRRILHLGIEGLLFCLSFSRGLLSSGLFGCFEKNPADVYSLPDVGAGKGIPLQQVSNKEKKTGNSTSFGLDRTSDQDLVSEQKDESQKGIKESDIMSE